MDKTWNCRKDIRIEIGVICMDVPFMQSTRDAQAKSIQQDQRQLAQAKKRLADVDKLMTRLYEDHVLGSLPEERYQKMTADYEAEQESLRTEIEVLEELIASQQEATDNYDRFAALVEKYVDIETFPNFV